jgi:branched-chain amino acid transport system ATP-binding protein
MLSGQDIRKTYGAFVALGGVSLSVEGGDILGVAGPNGAGKTTLFDVLTGRVKPDSGTVTLDGVDVTQKPAWQIARLGVASVVEGRGVFSQLTVEENLTLTFRQRGTRKELSRNLEKAYESFPALGERRTQTAGTLSGGQQRLLSLAKVLVIPPKLLVADELSLGLAPVVIDMVYQGLEKIRAAGTALLIVEQQVDRVLNISDKAVVLDRGSVTFEGPTNEAGNVIESLLARRERAGSTAAKLVDEAVNDGIDPERVVSKLVDEATKGLDA